MEARPGPLRIAAALIALMKPRIIELLLVTTVPTMILAAEGWPGTWLVVVTVLGGTLAAGGANATNMWIDRDIDRLMERTKGRPLVTGDVTPNVALVWAIGLQIAAFGLLWWQVNLLAAALAVGSGLFYIFVYSLWLKRTHRSNIVIGGAAGAGPVLVGWAAVTGDLSAAAWVLFAVIFLWTPAHFWALAIRYREDYQAADVPMLPAVATMEYTTTRILLYAVATFVAAMSLPLVADVGPIYLVATALSGGWWVGQAERLRRDPDPGLAMRTFGWSITMIVIVFGALAVDVLVRARVTGPQVRGVLVPGTPRCGTVRTTAEAWMRAPRSAIRLRFRDEGHPRR